MAGGAALEALQAGLHEDVSLEIIVPAARAVLAGGPPEMQGRVRAYLQETLSRMAQGTADEKIRVAWLTGPVGRELVELAGPMDLPVQPMAEPGSEAGTSRRRPSMTIERRLLQLLTEGRTNAEIATELELHRGGSGRAADPSVRPARRLEPRGGDVARVPRARHGRDRR